MSIKSTLKASSYSDSGVSSSDWHTYQDKQLTIKHTAGSVKYNFFEHGNDHVAEGTAQLAKLYNADRAEAEKLADEVCNLIDKWYDAVQEYKSAHYQRSKDI